MAEDIGSSFSYGHFEDVVKRFASEMPEYLLRHPSTAPIAFDLQRLGLVESMDTRFTVAIVGQMRVGKSTLLNALIGKNLAPTGVTETTATINWFRHGQGSRRDTFRVNWMDGSTDDIPLDRVGEWIGTEENAKRTRCLDFFADTDFLRMANVVDTPGTRSVIQTHEDATQGFLADKLEADTLRYGGSADAVVYAVNPVGRESDRDMLQLFGERTRLPGASAYNSIAVVQKWEHLQPDPLEEARKKCQMLKKQLEGKVAAVVPTSGLLYTHAMKVPAAVWQTVATLAIHSSEAVLEALLLSEQDFGDECPSAPLDQAERRALLASVSWKVLPFCINLARNRNLDDGPSLKSAVEAASGIPALRELLQRHFFSRARLIKASTILRKAWDPCAKALLTLRHELNRQTAMVGQGQEIRSVVAARAEADPELHQVEVYVAQSLVVVERDVESIKEIQREVDDLQYQAKKNFDRFDADIEALKLLEERSDAFTQDQADELARLFGQSGPALWTRLGYDGRPDDIRAALTRAQDRYSFWALQRQRSHGTQQGICDHAGKILELILNELEE